MQDSPRVLLLGLTAAFALAACDSGSATTNPADASTGSSVCGTHASPGILKVTGLSPAIASTVINQHIVHGFVVENAPAFFTNFTLEYRPTHTVGLPTPSDPTFQATLSGNNLIYQLTVDAWSRAPGHVEFEASGGYATSKGCYWEFPSPLFSYDITPVLDGGVTEVTVDGGGSRVDSPYDIPGALDAAGALDTPAEIDVSIASDGPATAEPDGGAPVQLDAPIDVARSLDASLD